MITSNADSDQSYHSIFDQLLTRQFFESYFLQVFADVVAQKAREGGDKVYDAAMRLRETRDLIQEYKQQYRSGKNF